MYKSTSPLIDSHSLILRSAPPVAKSRPEGLHCIAFTSPSCASCGQHQQNITTSKTYKGKREKRKEKKEEEKSMFCNRKQQRISGCKSPKQLHPLRTFVVTINGLCKKLKRVAIVSASQAKAKQQNKRLVKSKNIVQVIMYVHWWQEILTTIKWTKLYSFECWNLIQSNLYYPGQHMTTKWSSWRLVRKEAGLRV